jgi:KDO2-lipid IV(A) lauroyltransferase
VEYGALRVVAFVASLFPWRAASAIGAAVGTLGYRPLRIRRRVVDYQLALAFPELDAHARRRIAVRAYAHLGRVALEMAIVSKLERGAVLNLFHPPVGWEHIADPISQGRGVILVSGHLGNWELAAGYLVARGVATDVVVRRQTNPLVDRYVTRSRRRLGWTIIPDRHAVARIPRSIADGHVVPMLADQGVKGLASTFVPFFGRDARTPKGPALLALRLGAPCVLTAIIRQPDGRYRMHFEPVPIVNTGDRDRDVDAIVAAYTRQLEAWIRRYPEQYLWQHRRWRRRPDGSFEGPS